MAARKKPSSPRDYSAEIASARESFNTMLSNGTYEEMTEALQSALQYLDRVSPTDPEVMVFLVNVARAFADLEEVLEDIAKDIKNGT